VIYFPIFQPEGDFIIQQYTSVPGLENVIMFAADGLAGDDFMVLEETNGMYFSGPDLRFSGNTAATGKSYSQFLEAYEAEFGEPPPQLFHAHAYDATVMLLQAIASTVQQEGDTLFIDRQAVRDALYATSNFQGLTGTLTCDEFGDCGAQTIAIIQHTNPSDPAASRQNIVFSLSGR
jgi:branched-chain amino acid transport system substrate-binding protein